MFVLQLNPMQSNAENVVPVARAETREALIALLQRETVEFYTTDDKWRKCFRQGGPLEWLNSPGPHMEPWIGVPAIADIGTREDWMQKAGERYDRTMSEIPTIEDLG